MSQDIEVNCTNLGLSLTHVGQIPKSLGPVYGTTETVKSSITSTHKYSESQRNINSNGSVYISWWQWIWDDDDDDDDDKEKRRSNIVIVVGCWT